MPKIGIDLRGIQVKFLGKERIKKMSEATRHFAKMLFAAAVILQSATTQAQTPTGLATGAPPLTVNGSAEILTGSRGNPVIRLTPAQGSLAASVFTTNSIKFNSEYTFATFFRFQMTDPGGIGAADGMTFVLQTEAATAIGYGAGDLGYLGIEPSVGVEFDTFHNQGIDINSNTVSIVENGEMSDLDPGTPYDVANCQPSAGIFGCMSNGDVWSVWIEYDGTHLHVAIADNSTTRPANIIDYPIDIPAILGGRPAFVGFTAGTGAGWENHYVLEWQFSETRPR